MAILLHLLIVGSVFDSVAYSSIFGNFRSSPAGASHLISCEVCSKSDSACDMVAIREFFYRISFL